MGAGVEIHLAERRIDAFHEICRGEPAVAIELVAYPPIGPLGQAPPCPGRDHRKKP